MGHNLLYCWHYTNELTAFLLWFAIKVVLQMYITLISTLLVIISYAQLSSSSYWQFF